MAANATLSQAGQEPRQVEQEHRQMEQECRELAKLLDGSAVQILAYQGRPRGLYEKGLVRNITDMENLRVFVRAIVLDNPPENIPSVVKEVLSPLEGYAKSRADMPDEFGKAFDNYVKFIRAMVESSWPDLKFEKESLLGRCLAVSGAS